jgi:hypothetical protein
LISGAYRDSDCRGTWGDKRRLATGELALQNRTWNWSATTSVVLGRLVVLAVVVVLARYGKPCGRKEERKEWQDKHGNGHKE